MEWVKALHVISVIAWMAGMLYLPRLFVYHSVSETGSAQSETFKIMERRLLKGIINPAMIATYIFGFWMVFGGWVDLGAGWLHLKLAMVLLLTACHGVLVKYTRLFAQDKNTKPQKFFRILNEVPTVLMVIIVIAVVVKPF
ncbi:protoporphyrinogen oxidase HemJ [Devosia submarina]|jgi:putative membrane protein|uniref:protoporphyrinogen oxidase HemJ n=1 Tax=Devosia submarina TaxID=1173082 RepID=UPI000D38336A|nr:protoporphyrinogen oxidase HemJ [Devosia submarina]